MSTILYITKGKREIPTQHHPTPTYEKAQLTISSFYGGVKRGQCVQLTITSASGPTTHIQLTKQQCRDVGINQTFKNYI